MNPTNERTFLINQPPPELALTHPNAASITKVVLSRSTTHQPEQTAGRIISLGIIENEPIDDANSDMDMLAQQSFEDL